MKSINFKSVSFGYNENELIFDSCSFFIQTNKGEGKIISVMGASGVGKTTFLRLLSRAEKPKLGKIIISPNPAIISYMPQEPILFEHLSPLENAKYFSRISFYKTKFEQSLFEDLCLVLNMKDVLSKSKKISELSGGQKQRLSLLRALSINPDFLLLDEPTTGLDAEVKLQFMHKLKEVVKKLDITAFYVTHNVSEVAIVADKVLYLSAKHGVYYSSFQNILRIPPVIEIAHAFNYPYTNLIYIRLDKKNLIIFDSFLDCNFILLINKEQEMFFSKCKGIPVSILEENTSYSLELPNKQKITINRQIGHQIELSVRLLLSGKFLAYRKDGRFYKMITIKDNRVINNDL